MQYLFFLGREPDLSLAELISVLRLFGIKQIPVLSEKNKATLTTSIALSAEKLIARLGGTIKIAECIPSNQTPEDVIFDVLLTHKKESKVSFAVGGDMPPHHALTIKKRLRAEGRSVRAVEVKNSASIAHNHLVELGTDFTVWQKHVYKTVALQPFEDFGHRDFGRPQSDATSGMLPPKLARMMLNLASVTEHSVVLDPFCGSGTVLMEAITVRVKKVVGSDLSPKAIRDSKINTDWLLEKGDVHTECTIFECDARDLSKKLKPLSVDAIVTEPYLGEPLRGHEPADVLTKQAKELRMLYTKSLASMQRVLQTHGSLVMIFPEFWHKHAGNIPSITEKDITEAGFEIKEILPQKKSLLYRRPDQHVARRIFLLEKK